MSWGERSCNWYGDCKAPGEFCSPRTCHIACPWYTWDGETKQDSRVLIEREKAPTLTIENIIRELPPSKEKFCVRCRSMESKSHIKRCKRTGRKRR